MADDADHQGDEKRAATPSSPASLLLATPGHLSCPTAALARLHERHCVCYRSVTSAITTNINPPRR
uniref:Uncharacterized protein n=1 Tax=Arundo donax TaxID=35708 RepID=A0A0A9BB24_ARUDO